MDERRCTWTAPIVTCACSSGLPVHAAHATLHATLHATASRLGLRTEGRSIQKISLPSSDLHGTLFMRLPISFMRLPISPAMTPLRSRSHMRQGQYCCWVCDGSLIGVLPWPAGCHKTRCQILAEQRGEAAYDPSPAMSAPAVLSPE